MDTATSSASFAIAPFGFEGEENEGTGPANETPTQQESSATTESNDNESESDNGDDDEFNGLSEAELKDRLRKVNEAHKMVAQQAAQLKKAQTDAERAKNDELTNTQNDLKEATQTVEQLKQTNSHLALINSILSNSEYQWHNVEIAAQQVLSTGSVQVDPLTGKVEGLNRALKAVAKDHAYLLRTPQQQGTQGSNNGQQNGFSSTGIQPGQGGANGNVGAPTNADLVNNYPALKTLG